MGYGSPGNRTIVLLLAPRRMKDVMTVSLSLGLDVGSTTVKAVVTDGDEIVFSDYRRHNADARGALRELLSEIAGRFPGASFRCAITGSAGLGVAELMGVEFVQEVIASTAAIERFVPEADVVIELGGEDAKITFVRPVVEQRMNGTCAGGTGAFIDQMATLLHTDAEGLDALAAKYQHLYPIASRCGVFAKSDLQPLLNQGPGTPTWRPRSSRRWPRKPSPDWPATSRNCLHAFSPMPRHQNPCGLPITRHARCSTVKR